MSVALSKGGRVVAIGILALTGHACCRLRPPSLRPRTPRTSLPSRIVRARDEAAMVLIPAGTYWMGPGRYVDREIRHEVQLSGDFYCDVHEVTLAQFERFVQ